MGKLTDVVVKLLVDNGDYEKGLKKATGALAELKKTLKKTFNVAAIVTAGTTAIKKFASDAVRLTQTWGDKWAVEMSGMKAAYETFVRSLSSGEGFSGFFDNVRESVRLAREATAILDEVFERKISFSYDEAGVRKMQAELSLVMRDASKSNEERIAAAKKIQELEDGLAERKKAILEQEAEGYRKQFQSATGLENEEISAILREYNTNRDIINQAREYLDLRKKLTKEYDLAQQSLSMVRDRQSNEYAVARVNAAADALAALDLATDGTVKDLARLVQQYDKANDELVTAMANAEVAVINVDTEALQRKMRAHAMEGSLTVTLGKVEVKAEEVKVEDEFKILLEKLPEICSQAFQDNPIIVPIKFKEPDTEALKELEEWSKEADRICKDIGNSISSGIGGGIEEVMNQLMGVNESNAGAVFQAIFEPLADLAEKEGEILLASGLGIEALKESLTKLKGGAAITAGLALIAVGAAAKAGLSALSSGSGASASTSTAVASSSSQVQSTELTIYVTGKVKGSDLVISGQKTINSWGR